MNFSKWVAGFTSPPPLWKKKFFYRVLGRFSIVLEFLTLFANSSGELLEKKKKSEKSYPSTFQKFKFFLHHLLLKEEF